MRSRVWWPTCAVLGVLGLATHANERPTKEYVEAMRTLDGAARGLGHAIDARDHEAMNEHVLAARPAIQLVQQFWRDKGVKEADDALEAAHAVSKAISEISVAVHLMNLSPNPLAVEGAQFAMENLRTACATCHRAHREELPDGTYLIK